MISFFLAFATAPFILQAQSQIGLKAGYNQASIKDQLYEFAPISAYHFGVFYRQNLFGNFHFQSDLLFSVKGGQEGLEIVMPSNDEVDFKVQLQYLNLPIAVQYHLESIIFEVGGELGLRLNTVVSGDDIDAPDLVESIWNKDLDLGAFVGLGYQFGRFHLSGRYNFGLVGMLDFVNTDTDGQVISEGTSGYNRTLQFSLAYAFLNK